MASSASTQAIWPNHHAPNGWWPDTGHATESAVRNPPPVYDAKLVAEAILYCTRHRVREMTVGFAGRALTAFHQLAPAVAEPLARCRPATVGARGGGRGLSDLGDPLGRGGIHGLCPWG